MEICKAIVKNLLTIAQHGIYGGSNHSSAMATTYGDPNVHKGDSDPLEYVNHMHV